MLLLNLCSNLNIIKIISVIINICKYMLIILIILSMGKKINQKKVQIILKRIILILIVFFGPLLVSYLFDKLNKDEISYCYICNLNPLSNKCKEPTKIEVINNDVTSSIIENSSSEVISSTTSEKVKTPVKDTPNVIKKLNHGATLTKENGAYYINYKGEKIVVVNKSYGLNENFASKMDNTAKSASDQMCSDGTNATGLTIKGVSCFRSYARQKAIYNNYDPATRDKYSARPGFSEHETGLACDYVEPSTKNTPLHKVEFAWLRENAYKYGFILRYVDGKTESTGYITEAWHYRYVGKTLAKELYNNGDWLTIEEYFGLTSVYE